MFPLDEKRCTKILTTQLGRTTIMMTNKLYKCVLFWSFHNKVTLTTTSQNKNISFSLLMGMRLFVWRTNQDCVEESRLIPYKRISFHNDDLLAGRLVLNPSITTLMMTNKLCKCVFVVVFTTK